MFHLQNSIKEGQVRTNTITYWFSNTCIIYFSIFYRLATNTRVRVIHISKYHIRVQTLGEHPTTHCIPRIRFKLTLPWGQSYKLLRTQFPLRLAYALTINKVSKLDLKFFTIITYIVVFYLSESRPRVRRFIFRLPRTTIHTWSYIRCLI